MKKTRDIPEIHEQEYKLLSIIWNNGGKMRMKELAKSGNEIKGWARTTVYTMIKRLSDRGVVSLEYAEVTALISKEAVQKSKLNKFIDEVFNGSVVALKDMLSGQ